MSITSILIAIMIFSVIILFHELGHFLLAKKNGVIVEEFSLGMGPRIVSFVKGGTRYSWKILPFGGSCMMKGEDGSDDSEGSFNSKSVGARISVIAAGPIFNFIMAWVVAVIMIGLIGFDPAIVTSVTEGSPAAQAGLQQGDTVTKFMGTHVDIGRDMYTYTLLHTIEPGQTVTVSYEQAGEKKTASFVPETTKRYMLGFSYTPGTEKAQITEISVGSAMHEAGVVAGDVITAVDGQKVSTGDGLAAYMDEHPLSDEPVTLTYTHNGSTHEETLTPEMTEYVNLGFDYNLGRESGTALQTLKYSFIEVKYWIKTTVQSLGALVTGRFSVNDMMGPVGVVDTIGTTVEESKSEGATMVWANMLYMVILLSANLGVMNLLPIPALDGGRLVFLIIEGIRGKAVKRETEGMVHFVGLMLLLVLMVFVMYNDIRRLF